MALWGVRWRSGKETFEGVDEHLMFERLIPVIFRTRKKARTWIEKHYGYIKERKDLRGRPHFWRMPIAVKVEVIIKIGD